jgi:hypothetical protein
VLFSDCREQDEGFVLLSQDKRPKTAFIGS